MQPSTRTPEGEDNTCHVCGHAVRIQPTIPPGDAPCPYCGALLWLGDGEIDSIEASQAALQWASANAAIEANNLFAARRCLRRAIALDPSNAVFKETLASVEARMKEEGRRKRRRLEHPQPS